MIPVWFLIRRTGVAIEVSGPRNVARLSRLKRKLEKGRRDRQINHADRETNHVVFLTNRMLLPTSILAS